MNHFIGLLAFVSIMASLANAAPAKPVCGGSTSSKDIQLLQPTLPPRECVYHINAYSSNVCQLRIDFAMTLAQPSIPEADNNLQYAECVNDIFRVGDVKLCGTETKNHIYIPFNGSAGVTKIDISFILAVRAGGANNLPTPTWDVTVTQLECPNGAALRQTDLSQIDSDESLMPSMRASIRDGFWIAPTGCLQYFPMATGVVTSFNYDRSLGIYPGNMNYAICFRRQTETEYLVLRAVSFQLGAQYNSGKLMELDSYCHSNVRNAETHEDYLMVPQAKIQKSEIRPTYMCGNSINSETVISSNPGPLMMIFNSDDHYSKREAGFYINYSIL